MIVDQGQQTAKIVGNENESGGSSTISQVIFPIALQLLSKSLTVAKRSMTQKVQRMPRATDGLTKTVETGTEASFEQEPTGRKRRIWEQVNFLVSSHPCSSDSAGVIEGEHCAEGTNRT